MASLMPNRAESFNTRTRGTSHIDFKTATTGVAAKAMRNEISNLVKSVNDPVTKKVSLHRPYRRVISLSLTYRVSSQAFDTEMQSFFYLFTRYLAKRAHAQ